MIGELFKKSKSEIEELLKEYNIVKQPGRIYSDIVLAELKAKDVLAGSGDLEIMPGGFGFLRNGELENDIYLSVSQIKKLGLRKGDFVVSEVRDPLYSEKNYASLNVVLVNDRPIEESKSRVNFDDLAPHYPDKKLNLGDRISCRAIDLIAPIGLGQRGLVVAPPKAGKTILLSELANGIAENNDVEVWILLVDERPEEVTGIRESVKSAKVFASTFDEDPYNHVRVTDIVAEKAKRAVEGGRNIVILMDNITRLARAYNLVVPSSGKLVSGGLDPHAFLMPKRFFGAARNTKSGSLTIIATALVDTGSRMDDVIYEEFKGTGNLEIHLDRSIAEMKIFPAINIKRSGTRREELLLHKDELEAIHSVRRYLLSNFSELEAIKKLIEFIKSNKTNDIFLYKYLKDREKYEK